MVSWSALEITPTGNAMCRRDLGAVVAVSAGTWSHVCSEIRWSVGLLWINGYGQCDVPMDLGAVVAVSAGTDHTCAVRSDGQLVCFGNNGRRAMRCADGFGSSCGSVSRRSITHVQ